jgi:signal transduction histidine kinase
MFILVGAILFLLVAAYLYVIRVLRMTRHLEAEAQERERLSYLGLLSSGMAHEIKNPLNSIQVNLQLLEEELASGAPPAQAISYLQPVQKEVKRLERLVNDFLVYARPMTPKLAPVLLGQTLEDLRLLVAQEARQKGIALTVSCPPDLSIMADDGMLRIALLNLLLNAIHAEKEGGAIEVEATEDNGYARIAVRDHGRGVPEELRDKIFVIFFTDKPGGTGLGLPIARRIAETHGGTLALEESEGQGALFVMRLKKEPRANNDDKG